ncbi:MAG TPA: hypothetical protein VHZ52_08110 [Acidobacteriaceae bacterium]|jgi:hypothetical protein|nr:hypothetical protein [Acidobacteriaceae bacterium]
MALTALRYESHSNHFRLAKVVLEAETQLLIRPVEFVWKGRVVGAFDGSPGSAVERYIAGAAAENHGVGLEASVG